MNDEEMAIRQSSVEGSIRPHGTHTTVGTLFRTKVSRFEYRGDGFQFDFTRILAAGALVDTVLRERDLHEAAGRNRLHADARCRGTCRYALRFYVNDPACDDL